MQMISMTPCPLIAHNGRIMRTIRGMAEIRHRYDSALFTIDTGVMKYHIEKKYDQFCKRVFERLDKLQVPVIREVK